MREHAVQFSKRKFPPDEGVLRLPQGRLSVSAVIAFRWQGDNMEPLPRFRKECDKEFVIGETYILATQEPRSGNSHRHFFASIQSSWANLPERYAEQFPTSEHLRKYALIKGGYYHSDAITCASKAEAQRVASFIRPSDQFALVTVMGSTVTRYVAKSQNMRAMDKKEFQESKDRVLEIISEMVGVPVKSLTDNASAEA